MVSFRESVEEIGRGGSRIPFGLDRIAAGLFLSAAPESGGGGRRLSARGLAETAAGGGERVFVGEDGFVDAGVGNGIVVGAFKLAVEPAGEIA